MTTTHAPAVDTEKRVATLCFALSDQARFAQLSGDWNPLHVDAEVARRTLFGERVVHGLHALLRALDIYCEEVRGSAPRIRKLRSLRAEFRQPIYPDHEVKLTFSRSGAKAVLSLVAGIVELARFDLDIGTGDKGRVVPTQPQTRASSPRHLEFSQCANAQGHQPLWLDSTLLASMFPSLSERFDPMQIAELLSYTRLVGMECPGEYSIFHTIDVAASGIVTSDPRLAYKVAGADARTAAVSLQVSGPTLEGRLGTFMRPGPVHQLSMEEAKSRVMAGEFQGRQALIVGGSRGIGEATAKLIAAGGGSVAITYARAEEAARRVVEEIGSASGRGVLVQYDVESESADFSGLADSGFTPTHVYYFASPKIFALRRAVFDADLHVRFSRFYLEGFVRVYRACRKLTSGPLVMFYPSSVALENTPDSMVEYVLAKLAGERLCEYLVRCDRKLSVSVPRLPRIATDQTVTLLPYPAREAAAVMLELLRAECVPGES